MELVNKEKATKLIKPGILAALSQVPIISAFSTFYSEFVSSNWQERTEKTQEELINKFSKLDEQFEEKIRERSNFASLLGTAYQSALTDIEENKIPLYINSLINAIKNEDIDNTKVHIFLNFLKDFTLLHIQILTFFKAVHCGDYQLSLNSFGMVSKRELNADIIKTARPELIQDIDLFETIMDDLYSKNLITLNNLASIDTNYLRQGQGIYSKFTTPLGDEFLEFIDEYNR